MSDVSTSKPRSAWFPMLRACLVWTALANLAWEWVQLPLYTIWAERSRPYNAFAAVLLALVVAGTEELADSSIRAGPGRCDGRR